MNRIDVVEKVRVRGYKRKERRSERGREGKRNKIEASTSSDLESLLPLEVCGETHVSSLVV